MKRWTRTGGGILFPEEGYVVRSLNDKVNVVGVLTLVQWPEGYPDEVEVLVGPDKNLVVNGGRNALLNLAAGIGTAADKVITTLGVGDGSNGGASTPSGPTTALFNELTDGTPARYTLTHSYGDAGPTNVVSLWSAQIPAGDLNGSDINEAGLFCNDGTLFAMRTFGNQAKTSGFVFEFRWLLTY